MSAMRWASASTLACPNVSPSAWDLAIEVGFADVIEIDQGERAERAARQSLHHPGADAANAEHGHARAFQPAQAVITVNTAHATEAAAVFVVADRAAPAFPAVLLDQGQPAAAGGR